VSFGSSDELNKWTEGAQKGLDGRLQGVVWVVGAGGEGKEDEVISKVQSR